MNNQHPEPEAERQWKRWWVHSGIDATLDMPQFCLLYPSAQKGLVPWEHLCVTGCIAVQGDQLVAYKVFRRTATDELAWNFWLRTETVKRRSLHEFVRIMEAEPIGLHSLFPKAQLPRSENELAYLGLKATRAKELLRGPPPYPMSSLLYLELNWEYRRFSLEWAKFQTELQVFGQSRVKRCYDGAVKKLGGGLWEVAEQVDANPKDIGIWQTTGAPFVLDEVAFFDPDRLALHPRVSRAMRESLIMTKLAQFEHLSQPERHWTPEEAESFIEFSKKVCHA